MHWMPDSSCSSPLAHPNIRGYAVTGDLNCVVSDCSTFSLRSGLLHPAP